MHGDAGVAVSSSDDDESSNILIFVISRRWFLLMLLIIVLLFFDFILSPMFEFAAPYVSPYVYKSKRVSNSDHTSFFHDDFPDEGEFKKQQPS